MKRSPGGIEGREHGDELGGWTNRASSETQLGASEFAQKALSEGRSELWVELELVREGWFPTAYEARLFLSEIDVPSRHWGFPEYTVLQRGMWILLILVALTLLAYRAITDHQLLPSSSGGSSPPLLSDCPECGATFEIVGGLRNSPEGRGQIQVSITNTGKRGTLDFSTTTGSALELGFDEFLGVTYAGRERTLVGWEDEAGGAASPVLPPGQTWNGWLTFDDKFNVGTTDGLILKLTGFQGDSGRSLSWVYRTPWPPNQGGKFELKTPTPASR